jgi:hypothetical protein
LNKGNLQFEDITEKAGVPGRPKWKTGVVMADVNGDGLLDIYVCYSGPGTDEERANELYINTGVQNGIPVFKEQAKQYGIDAPGTYTTTASFFDMDNDGDLDLFMVNHADLFLTHSLTQPNCAAPATLNSATGYTGTTMAYFPTSANRPASTAAV